MAQLYLVFYLQSLFLLLLNHGPKTDFSTAARFVKLCAYEIGLPFDFPDASKVSGSKIHCFSHEHTQTEIQLIDNPLCRWFQNNKKFSGTQNKELNLKE